MTTAQKISAAFHDDGQCWTNDDAEGLFDVCADLQPCADYRDGYGTDVLRFTFKDDSTIVLAGDCWDLGYPGCYCLRGNGHSDDCEAN